MNDIIPQNDEHRIEALLGLEILYTEPEAAFDNITQMMAQVFHTPMAFISLVDKEKVFYKSQVGPFGRDHVQRKDSLCSYTVLNHDPLIIEDVASDVRFVNNPYVGSEGGIRFYAGAPLTTKDGFHIGTVCLVDIKSRKFSEEDKELLVRFAKLVMHEIEMRRSVLEQIANKEELQKTEIQLRAALAISKIAPWHWDVISNRVYGNEELANMFGVNTSDAIEGLPLEIFVQAMHPDDQQKVLSLINKSLESGEEYEAEYRVNNSKGDEKWVIARGRARYEEGRAVSLTGSLIDITDRKQGEAILIESQQRFYSLANSITQLAWIADAEGWVFWYNDRWYDFTGTTLEEMQGWGWEKVHHPDHIERVVSFVKEAWHKDEPWELIFPLRQHDGVYRWFLTRGVPVRNKEGAIVQWIGTNTDIDDQKQAEVLLEQRVQERTLELAMRTQELEQFTYVSHHDLQEPLRKILMFSDMVRSDSYDLLSEASQNRLDKVTDAAQRMSMALRDVMSFASLSKVEQFIDVDLEEVLATVQMDLELMIQERDAKIQAALLPTIQAIPSQMHQLLYNLINNALKFSKPDQQPIITITCEKLFNHVLLSEHGLEKHKHYYLFVIKDNGIGFNNESAEKIFVMFQRLHGRDAYAGTGIGLALCKKVVQNHRGKIWAESNVEEGATFKVLLPSNHK